jgi:hypothetical protein
MRERSAPTMQGRVWVQFTKMISVHLEGCVVSFKFQLVVSLIEPHHSRFSPE